jgi:hypothetical protein
VKEGSSIEIGGRVVVVVVGGEMIEDEIRGGEEEEEGEVVVVVEVTVDEEEEGSSIKSFADSGRGRDSDRGRGGGYLDRAGLVDESAVMITGHATIEIRKRKMEINSVSLFEDRNEYKCY